MESKATGAKHSARLSVTENSWASIKKKIKQSYFESEI